MSPGLPTLIDPLALAERGVRLSGALTPEALERLGPLLASTRGSIAVDLEFGIDAGGHRVLTGNVVAELRLECQRCLAPMDLRVEHEVRLALVGSLDEAARLSADYEPLLCGEEPRKLADLVEDELLLALPQVPRHAEEACANSVGLDSGAAVDEDQAASPFAVLARLKRE